jgi:hypothetical protein
MASSQQDPGYTHFAHAPILEAKEGGDRMSPQATFSCPTYTYFGRAIRSVINHHA